MTHEPEIFEKYFEIQIRINKICTSRIYFRLVWKRVILHLKLNLHWRTSNYKQEKSSKSLGRKSAFFGLEKSRILVGILHRNNAQ